VLPDAIIGVDCNICDGVFIENDVVLGDRVTVKCGVQLWDGTRIGDDVFIGPNATFTNDSFPRSQKRPAAFLTTEICDGATIGANATILPGLVIGRHAMVGAGSVVTEDVPANAKVVGNPGRIIGYVDDMRVGDQPSTSPGGRAAIREMLPDRVRLIDVPKHADLRGSLTAGEVGGVLPFTPARYFVVFDVPTQHVRGEHAHRECAQFITCLAGSVTIHLDDGQRRVEVVLDARDCGLLIPPMVWASQFKYSDEAMLLVLASHTYDPADYIRDYSEFLSLLASSAHLTLNQ
jgi:acetyltransferase-like isoleucine patch superfamily enzyme/dTDP-4-dehydrorhamnose 3,5-epimerase-like enzyme